MDTCSRTTNWRVCALGEIAGHEGSLEARPTLDHLPFEKGAFFRGFRPPRRVWVNSIMTDPQILAIGVSSSSHRRAKKGAPIFSVSHTDRERIQLEQSNHWAATIETDPNSKQIYSAHIRGPRATDLAVVLILLMELRLPLDSLRQLPRVSMANIDLLRQLGCQNLGKRSAA